MNFYKHYLGDYIRDTKGLSVTEHGAYRLLLDHCYATEQPIPNEVTELYRIAGAITTMERKAVEKVAEKFFPVNGDGRRHNRRAEVEIQKHSGQVQANRIVAEERERKRRELQSLNDGSNDQITNRSTIEPPNQNQKPERTKTSPANAGEGRDEVAAIPDCPHEKLIALYHEVLPTCTQVVEWNDQRKAIARARWREKGAAKPGYHTVEGGLAYWRRFFEYVAQSKFLTGKAEPGRDRKPFVATLEWLLRPKNFAKVVEGSYHS